jgi:hypothetical protein
LAALTDHIQKSQSDDYGFRVALAQTLASLTDVVKSQGELLKSLNATAAVTPARAPKSQGLGVAPMQKSFAGAPPANGSVANQAGEGLSKGEILDAMEGMLHKSILATSGEDLVKSISKYESMNQISPALLADVEAFVAKNKAA